MEIVCLIIWIVLILMWIDIYVIQNRFQIAEIILFIPLFITGVGLWAYLYY